MTLKPFAPLRPIEQRILDARDGRLAGDALMLEIADTHLFVPSRNPVSDDGSRFSPVVLEQDDVPYIAVFTEVSRQPADMAGHSVQMAGRSCIEKLPPGFGLAVNPGFDAQLLVPPQSVVILKQDLKRPF